MPDYALLIKTPVKPKGVSLTTDTLLNNRAIRQVKNITNEALGWNRTEKLVGGWWDGGFTMADQESVLRERFTSWLNHVIEEIAGVTTWRGIIWRMVLSSNGVSREISLDSVYNAVAARFTEHLTNGGFEAGSGTTFTGWTNTANSGSIAQETTAANVARGSRAVKLTGNAMVSQSVTVKPNRGYRLAVQTRGEAFNDVANGDFETAGSGGADVFSGWTEFTGNGTIVDETTNVAKGSHAAKLTNGAILYQSVDVRPKYEYKFSVYTRTAPKVSLTNGNLEDGSGTTFTGWTNTAGIGTIANETSLVAKGNRAVKLSNGAKLAQTIAVKAKHEYEFSVHTRTNPQVSLLNGNLEDGLGSAYSNWTNVTGTGTINNELTNVAKGNRAVRITGNAYMHQAVTVKPGNEYKFSMYTRGDGTDGGRVTIYDVTNSNSIVTTESTDIVDTSYRGKTYEFVAPPSCTSIRVEIHGPNTAGSAYYDAMTFEQITEAACGRVTVYDVTNSAYIVKERPTDEVSDSYSDFSVKFVAPPSCTSIRVDIIAPVQGDAYFDDMTFTQLSDDACGNVIIYDVTNLAYIVNSESTGVVSDRYSKYERSFVVPPSCTSIRISLIAPVEGEVYFDQAELDYVVGANSLRMRVYDNTNAAYIVFVKKTGHSGDKYSGYDLDFVTPDNCTSVNVILQGGLDSVIWVDEASMRILNDDSPGDALTTWATNDASIQKYGRKEYIVDATAQPQDTAEDMRDGVLNISAWPRIKETSYTPGDIKAPVLTVYCLGFLPASNKRAAEAVDERDRADMIGKLIGQSDYLTTGKIAVSLSTARMKKDIRGGLITELARASLDGDGVTMVRVDHTNRVTVANATSDMIPVYYLRNGVISDNRSGSQPASVRHLRPGFLIDLDWSGPGRTTGSLSIAPRATVIDNSRTGVIASISVNEDGTYKIEPAAQNDLDTYLKNFET